MRIRNPVIESWFYRVLSLELGEELFIPCEDRKDREKTVKQLEDMLKNYIHIEPILTSQLVFRSAYRDGGHWVRALRKPNDPSILFKKHSDGSVTKETISDDFKIKRMVSLMLRDGWTRDYIVDFFKDIASGIIDKYIEEG